jgi:hypothetical protein
MVAQFVWLFLMVSTACFAQNLPGGGELSIIKPDTKSGKYSPQQMKQIEHHFLKFVKKRIGQCKIEDIAAPKTIREFYHLLDGEKLSLDPKVVVVSNKKVDCSLDSSLKKSQQLAQCLFYDEIFQKYLMVMTHDTSALIDYIGVIEGDDVNAVTIKNYFQSLKI